MAFRRYVALGDSTTEGLDDPRPGGGYRGWADRLAERLAVEEPGLLYANLAVRGRRLPQVHAEQLRPALELEPDLVTVVAGLNDLLHRRYDPAAMASELEAMLTELRATGATVATFTLPDVSAVVPFARFVRPRLDLYNEAILDIGARTGAIVMDLASAPITRDPRSWSVDRLHASTLGHVRIAAGMCDALGLAGSDGTWAEPLPERARRRRHAAAAAEVVWMRRHFGPWLIRRARGRSSGDGRLAKAPQLIPVEVP